MWGRRLGHYAPAGSIHVLTGYAKGTFAGHAVGASLAVARSYDPAGPAGGGADVAVVTLATPLPGPVLGLWDGALPSGTRLMLAGYGQDRAERLMADTSCAVRGRGPGADGAPVLVHDCAGTRGTSGAPLLAQASDGAWRVAAIQAAGREDDAGGFAVPADAVRALLRAH